MFKELLALLLAPAPEPLTDEGARMALTALLVRIARSDHNYSEVEKDRIDRIICSRFGQDAGGAIILREQAEAMEAEAPDSIGVVEAMWQVVLADGRRDAGEDAVMRLTAKLLGVSDLDSAKARKRMEETT
jgi:uncharacterized tellurite resistance protein B-like protein